MSKININKQYKTRSKLPIRIKVVDSEMSKKQRVYAEFFINHEWVSSLWDIYGRYNIDTQDDHFLDLIEVGG